MAPARRAGMRCAFSARTGEARFFRDGRPRQATDARLTVSNVRNGSKAAMEAASRTKSCPTAVGLCLLLCEGEVVPAPDEGDKVEEVEEPPFRPPYSVTLRSSS